MGTRLLLNVSLLAIWMSLLIAGFAVWEHYEVTPVPWGSESESRPASGASYEVVMFVHPHCPCTRASLKELAEIVRCVGADIAVRIVFVLPVNSPLGWERGSTWDLVRELGFAHVACDAGGAEARLAGATTSGMVVVYDVAGDVAFRGGITRARGRSGDSSGRQAVTALLAGIEPATREASAFGCQLLDTLECQVEPK